MPLERPKDTPQDRRTRTGTGIPSAAAGNALELADAIRRDGFAYLPAPEMRGLIGETGADQWSAFAGSWDTLETDRFMNDGGTYRRRRHAVFSTGAAGLVRQPDRPHFQEVAFNRLNGGVSRSFAPVAPDIAGLPLARAVISSFVPVFDTLSPQRRQRIWDIEMHQFRIEAARDRQGLPTPEGVHRDGVDWVVMMLVDRTNVSGGSTSLEEADGTPLFEVLMEAPLDTVVLDDRRLRHGASPISALHHEGPAHRDMLVLTYTGSAAIRPE